MPIELMEALVSAASPTRESGARILSRILNLSSIVLGVLGLCLIWGCAGPSQQVLTAQALSQRQAPNPNQDLQNQLIIQAAQAPLVNYKDYQWGRKTSWILSCTARTI